MRCYIAGPMTHYRLFNFPAFDNARNFLLKCGHEVISPADIDRAHGFDGMLMSPDDPCDKWPTVAGFDVMACIQRDIDAIKTCDVVYMLKGWEKSISANAEFAMARWMGKKIVYSPWPLSPMLENDIPGRITEVTKEQWDCLPMYIQDSSSAQAESDPHGKDPHAGGAKLDVGKVKANLLIEDFPRAFWAVAEVATFGANKYTESGWVKVPDAIKRYGNAKVRHQITRAMGEACDAESKMLHLAHEAWNCLAVLELTLREEQNNNKDGK